MHLPTILTTLAATALGVAHAAPAITTGESNGPAAEIVVEKRTSRIGAFGSSYVRACPLVDVWTHEFPWGSQSSACRTFRNGISLKSVDVYDWDPRCTLTLYVKNDCSDPGVVSGPNCWSPEGGFGGYKVQCPWL